MASAVDDQNPGEEANVEESDESSGGTEKSETVAEGEAKLSKSKLRKLKKKENALKYRQEKRLLKIIDLEHRLVVSSINDSTTRCKRCIMPPGKRCQWQPSVNHMCVGKRLKARSH